MDAQQIWDATDLLEIPAKTADEPRFLVVGVIAGKHWSGGRFIGTTKVLLALEHMYFFSLDAYKKAMQEQCKRCVERALILR